MKKIFAAILVAGALLGMSAVPVYAEEEDDTGGANTNSIWGACDENSADSAICADPENTEANSVVKLLLNTAFYAIGVLSVIMIVFSGFKYINSRGDAEGVKSAKNTLLYAVIGLIVSMLAFVIVNYVIGVFNSDNAQEDTATSQTEEKGN